MKTTLVLCATVIALLPCPCRADESKPEPIRVGWIGAMTGPATKYGVHEAARLALEDVNAGGGINGRPLEIIFEDGKCESKAATEAANKLINIDKVRYIVGGHCSPETMPIAPLAERNRVILLAALTSNPMLTAAGDYIFRVTAVSTKNSDILADYAYHVAGQRRLAILAVETDYVRPVAQRLGEQFTKLGGTVVVREDFPPTETDFRAILTRIRAAKADALFLGVQAPDTAELVVKQLRDLKFSLPVYGNEATGSAPATSKLHPSSYEGLVFAQVVIDRDDPKTKAFVEKFKTKYQVNDIPYVLTPEGYDTVFLLADTIRRCGDDVEKVKECLYQVTDFHGASGSFSIDPFGDAVREHALMVIRNGKPERIR